jgi:uncharacterized membrane protein (DUF106 family)
MAAEAPLPASGDDDEEVEAQEEEAEEEIDREVAKRPPAPGFKLSTFLYTFLFLLGMLMIFDQGTRYGVAEAFGLLLGPLIGFGGHYPLLTMFLAAAFEMALTAVAYNYTTDWVKAARVQKWSQALRKVQMAAMRSGKKDRIAALQTHQQTLAKLSTEVTFAQLKGMAITWFLVIALYSWVFLFLANPATAPTAVHAACVWPSGAAIPANGVNCPDVTTYLGPVPVNLLGSIIGPIQLWFLVFSLYTVPLSLLFRRFLKHYSLRRRLSTDLAPPPGGPLPTERPA